MEKTGLHNYAIGWTCIDNSNRKHIITPKLSAAEQKRIENVDKFLALFDHGPKNPGTWEKYHK